MFLFQYTSDTPGRLTKLETCEVVKRCLWREGGVRTDNAIKDLQGPFKAGCRYILVGIDSAGGERWKALKLKHV